MSSELSQARSYRGRTPPTPEPPVLEKEKIHVEERSQAYQREVDQLVIDIRNARAQIKEQMDVDRQRLTKLERSSPPPRVSDEPRQNAGHRGPSGGSLEAGGRSPRPKHQNSFGNLCQAKQKTATASRGGARYVPSDAHAMLQYMPPVRSYREPPCAYNIESRLSAAAAQSNRQNVDTTTGPNKSMS